MCNYKDCHEIYKKYHKKPVNKTDEQIKKEAVEFLQDIERIGDNQVRNMEVD